MYPSSSSGRAQTVATAGWIAANRAVRSGTASGCVSSDLVVEAHLRHRGLGLAIASEQRSLVRRRLSQSMQGLTAAPRRIVPLGRRVDVPQCPIDFGAEGIAGKNLLLGSDSLLEMSNRILGVEPRQVLASAQVVWNQLHR